ncbi:hypothetical protein K439DRAFT_1649948 [Ramaria rubella]|nr:hypothetical protein K439DRAFT_1649948 [Ramaria rubella]
MIRDFRLNHRQIKDSSTESFLLADRVHFEDIVEHLLSISIPVLTSMTNWIKNDEMVMAETEDEKACYRLLNDLDHVSSPVDGSDTMRKFMRNECWSLLAYLGAPTWYITFSPADLIADNPVASARFFHIIVQAFLKHVIGTNEKDAGLYGRSSGYYGTVEQQGASLCICTCSCGFRTACLHWKSGKCHEPCL